MFDGKLTKTEENYQKGFLDLIQKNDNVKHPNLTKSLP